MEILIYRTDIGADKIHFIRPILNANPQISKWSIDTEDIDNVLRIQSNNLHCTNDITSSIQQIGFLCEELAD